MNETQISIDELVKSYQNEISALFHSKIMYSLQVEKLSERVKTLESELEELRIKLAEEY
jgi:dynactin complex subunit